MKGESYWRIKNDNKRDANLKKETCHFREMSKRLDFGDRDSSILQSRSSSSSRNNSVSIDEKKKESFFQSIKT